MALTVYDFFDGQELTRPDVTPAEAEAMAAKLFGIVGTARELGSHQDRNFRIDTNGSSGATSYLLKVDNSAFSAQELEAQDAAMTHLSARGLRVPAPIRGLDGRTRQTWPTDRASLSVRLLTFLAGTPLTDQRTFGPTTISALGALCGSVVRGLADFDCEGLDRSLQWDLRSGGRVVDRLIGYVSSAERQGIVTAATASALERLAPVTGELRVQPIHGDITDDNVLGDETGGAPVPTAVIDFGDLGFGWLVAEIAVTVSSILHHVPGNPAAAIAAITAFDQQVALTDDEIAALWPLVVLRGAVLVVSGEYQVRIDGGNDYAAERTDHEWRLFEDSLTLGWDQAESLIRTALGRSGPRAQPVGEWILAGLRSSDVASLDLSVTAAGLNDGRWLEEDAEWKRARQGLERSAVLAAPYGHYRMTRSVPNSSTQPHTLSLVWDLFVAAGTPVCAPIDARVVAVTADAVHLQSGEIQLRLGGLVPAASVGDSLTAGATVGVISEQRPGIGRLRVQRVATGTGEVPAFSTPAEAAHWMTLTTDPAEVIGLQPAPNPFDPERELERRSHIFASAQERYYVEPPQIERGWKEFLVASDGRVLLDMVNNVSGIGHAHPRQVEAVAAQMALLNTNSRFLYRALADLSERLVAMAPDPSLDTVLLVNSGTEAVDLALRLAQVFTGRRPIVALREAYHGWSMGADAITTSAYDNPSALSNRPEWVEIADVPNPYRGQYRGADSAERYLVDLRAQLDAMIADGRHPAGFICEPILGNAGGVLMPDGYLAGAYREIRERGGLCIADEVQVGYGRLGSHLWGVQQQGAVPDIVTIAKAMGNGYPLGAVITRTEIAESLSREGSFFSSAGGSPVSCVAGLAVLDVMRDEKLQENAEVVGRHLVARLEQLATRHQIIGAVHGMGLYLGVELVRDRQTLTPATEETAAVCERLLELGVVMQPTSERQNVLKVKPPLCLSLASADFFVDALDRALGEL